MSDLAEQESPVPPLLRDRSGVQRVTNIELFFDLVYVFAVTQLSHYLIGHSTAVGALQAGLLLAMVWLVWAYTTWLTNWLDPELMAVRSASSSTSTGATARPFRTPPRPRRRWSKLSSAKPWTCCRVRAGWRRSCAAASSVPA